MTENNNESYKLTDGDIDNIAGAMNDILKSNSELQSISNMPSNNGVSENNTEPEKGEARKAQVKIDPNTGEKSVVGIVENKDKDLDDVFKSMGEAAENVSFDENFEIHPEDIKTIIKEDDMIKSDFELSDAAILELIDLVNRYRAGESIRYKDIPLEARSEYFDKLLSQNGISPTNFSKEANSVRNELAEIIISNFETNLSMNKFMEDYNKEMENIFVGLNDQISTYIKNYDAEKTKYLEKVCANITDENKKKKLEQVLDSIYDSYKLSRMKGFHVRIKKFDLEKPDRVFEAMNYKYANDTKYNIYELHQVASILSRHLTKNNYNDFGLKFILTFCKFVQNYTPNNPIEHAFMYYVLYNIVLLDVYHNKDYDEFAHKFLANIAEVMGEKQIKE